MTHEAKAKDPIIKQHFDAIEDQVVADAIAQRMARIHDSDGSRYSHETHMGTHDSMQYIADACARVYQPDMTHEEIWRAGLRHCVSNALENAQKIEEGKLADAEGLNTEWDRSMSIHAAIAMYAFERQSPTYDPKCTQDIDPIILSMIPNLRETLARVTSHMRAFGTVLYDEASSKVTPLYTIALERRRELDQINYEKTLKGLLNPQGIPKERWESNEDYQRYKYDYMRIRNADMTYEQYDAFAAAVQQFTLAGHWANAAALRTLPKDYLADAYESHNEAAQTIELLLEAYLQSAPPDEEADPNFYTVLHDYFPGGLTGDIARAHPLIQRLYAKHNGALNLLMDTLPTAEYVTGNGTHIEVHDRNQLSRSIMQAAFREILGDDEKFAAEFYADVKKSVEPRTFNKQDKISHDELNDRHLLSRLQQLQARYGTETLKQLHSQFDLSAYDYLTDDDLDTLIGLQQGDPETIKRLQAKDVSLVMYDARGSDNRAIAYGLNQFVYDNPLLSRIAISWRRPTDFYRTVALLEQYNIQFCNLFFIAHGSQGSVSFNRGDESIRLSSMATPLQDPIDRRAGPKTFHISDSQLGRIVRDRMCLPKHAEQLSQPNKKRVVFANCYSDVEPTTTTKSIADIAATAIGNAQLWPQVPKPIRSLQSRATPRREVDGTVDGHVVGTANISSFSERRGGGISLGGPARGESDSWDDNRVYRSNTVILTPYENRVWIGGKQVGSNLSIKRSHLDERIIA